ncbi:hypothetical protein DOA83_07145 [Salmonella enterica subsp. enterica serovar Mikawasima]|uniref:Uncharacterized protein n=1 Tax=Salmonella enterica subsp. enterica serovar Mikawasima TaxID=149388 RepID=A0A5H8NW10_SALET|nr:hypothetical protein [Salmonella enterica subsp. enterica serovar Mikawasima]EAB8695007.1 hypothetical protein [Salmonella enterica]EBR0195883.1 hypothetical protein [Salmonella enterica subsp. enterica serovar Bonn]EBX4838871.1 hypothetical protein [Salmonella enterica subsp. enterica serovar Tamberma]EBY7290490.1 hypothetical protein [Salmonella enterica subsp. enterica serovar Concord]ECT7868128.1 hypothetical protein [Salmonella enterica subsp. enterica serovar Poona]EGW4356666.1 hypot
MPSVTHPLPCIVYFLYVNFDECIKALINFSIAMHGSRYFGKFKEKSFYELFCIKISKLAVL